MTTKVQLVSNIIGNVSGGASFTGIVTASSFVGALTGNATGLSGSPNITVGIITATNVVIGGGTTQLVVTGNARVTGVVTASAFSGDGSNLTGVGGGVGQPTGDTDGLFNYVAVASTITQNITFDTTNSGAYDSYVVSVVPDITIESGVGVTVGTGKTMIIDILNLRGL